MCHLVRDAHALPRPEGRAAPASESPRSRWLAGATAMAAAGLVLAGWLALPAASVEPVAQEVTPSPAASPPAEVLRTASGSAESALFASDEVPTAPGELRKAAGHCEYGL